MASSVQDDWRTTCSSHSAQMLNALEHGILSDVTFLVGHSKELIKAHRTILSLGSPIFQALLTGKSFDETPIPIPHVQPKEFKPLLKYLYIGEIPEISDEDYPEFFKAVKYFMVRRLYPICTENILKKLTSGNALKFYEECKILEEKDLEDAADAFIKKNAEAILAEPKFLELSADNLVHFISADDFSAKEIPICLAVYKWGQWECDRQNLEKTPENLRFVLKNIIPQIRFPLMDPKEFALQIAPLNILTSDEHVSILTYFIMGNLPDGVRFISKPRIGMIWISVQNPVLGNNIQQLTPNSSTSLVNVVVPVAKKGLGRIYNDFQIGYSHTLSNKDAGSTNYLIMDYFHPGYTLIVTKDLSKYWYEGGERYLSTRWIIWRGSEPNSFTLYSKLFNGYLMFDPRNEYEGCPKITLFENQAQNLIFEHSQTPGYFILNCGPNWEIGSNSWVISKGICRTKDMFSPIFIRKPEMEDDSILWSIDCIN